MHHVKVYNNVISEENLNDLHNLAVGAKYRFGWKANTENNSDLGHWNRSIVSLNPGSSLSADASDSDLLKLEPAFNGVWRDIQINIGHRRLARAYLNLYTYGTEGYVHIDDPEINAKIKEQNLPLLQETFVVYLNKEWNVDWAGETVIFNRDKSEIVYASLPKYGKVLAIDGSLPHVGRSVSRICPQNRIIAAFKTIKELVNEQDAIEYFKSISSGIGHSNSTYFNHCYGTYMKLKGMGLEENVCLAGLYHSVYSTEYFKNPVQVNRKDVSRFIGEYAEDLVHTFCTLPDRIKSIMKNNMFSDVKNYHLACIEYANLLEQQPRVGNQSNQETIDFLGSVIDSYKRGIR